MGCYAICSRRVVEGCSQKIGGVYTNVKIADQVTAYHRTQLNYQYSNYE